MTTIRGNICLLLCLYLIGCASIISVKASYLDSKTIHIGVLGTRGKDVCFQQWRPTAVYLEQQLRTKVQIVCLNYDEVDNAVRDEHVDFTITNPSMYVNLEHKYGASRIATLKSRSPRISNSQVGGVIFYRADRTDIKNVADLRGKRFMAVAKNSFGGWLVTWRYLQNRGIDPYNDFQELLFGGRQDSVVAAVANGTVDAGCVRTETLERMAWEQKILLNDFNIIDAQKITPQFSFLRTTSLYPEWPLAKIKHTNQELAKDVALVMMQMPAESQAAIMSRTQGWTIPLDYHKVHDCLRQLKVAPYSDFGTISIHQLYQQYKQWIYVGIIFLVCTFSGVSVMIFLNKRLKAALVDLNLEHQQREQLLADLGEFKLTLDQTLDCVFIFDADSLKFIYVNQGALDLIGYSREEMMGMTPLDIKPDAIEAEFRAMMAPLKEKTGTSLTYININKKKDGTLFPVEVFMQHITPPQKLGRFVAIVRDITIRLQKESEREVLRMRLLQEQKMASVGQLAAGIAHEINTPAQYLGSNIDFLGEAFESVSKLVSQFSQLLVAAKKQEISKQIIADMEKDLDEVDWPYLEQEIPKAIQESVNGLKQVSSIIHAMKNFAHPGGIEKEMTDLNELLNTTLTVSRNEWKYIVEMVLQLDPLLPPVPCIRHEIGQVFLNIIVNAAHSIEENLGQKPGEQKGLITVSSKELEDKAIITVADSGCGISEDNLVKIFDPFFTTKEVGKGTGQGLTIAYDIVINKHGGSIDVTSEEGVGTTFTITLPIHPNPILTEGIEENHHV